MAYPVYPYQYQYYPQSYSRESDTMHWVEGEVGAKAFQKPPELPFNKPIALWDSTEKKIFLKSWNNMGMANQMQELTYEIKEQPNPIILENTSGDTNYATKDDLEELKQEIKRLSNNISNNGNRGGNR